MREKLPISSSFHFINSKQVMSPELEGSSRETAIFLFFSFHCLSKGGCFRSGYNLVPFYDILWRLAR